MRSFPFFALCLAVASASGCVTTRKQHLTFEGAVIEGDPELQNLTDEELFAAGSAAFGGSDFKQAARYFGRISDFHPKSPHWLTATFNAGLAHQRLKQWDEAYMRFSTIADAPKGAGDALEA